MSSGWTKFLPVPVLVAALGALYSNPTYIVPFLDKYGGRLSDFQPAVQHLHHGALNNDKCWKNPGQFRPTLAHPKIFSCFVGDEVSNEPK